jgi:DNA-binding LacI/PurR family transcriptional regulator
LQKFARDLSAKFKRVQMKEKVTQGDIAEKLNLSVTTVSRALQNDPVINPETRAEVLNMAARMNYQPRQSRQTRSQAEGVERNHRFVCVIVKLPLKEDAWAPDEVASGYLAGMSEVCASLNVSLVVHHVNDDNAKDLLDPEKQPPIMKDPTLSGIILIHYFPHDLVKALNDKWPVVAIVHDVPSAKVDLIDMDNHQAVSDLVSKLINKGHKKIGFIGYRPQLSWSRSRLGGYLQALYTKDIDIDKSIILKELDEDLVVRKLDEDVTAWVCSIDLIAYDLYRRLLDRGIEVPDKLSITGFNKVSPLLNCPQVTTIEPPFKQMGVAALHRLMLRVEEPLNQTLKILHKCNLIVGESTGPIN